MSISYLETGFNELITEVNSTGFASIQLDMTFPEIKPLGQDLYLAMDSISLDIQKSYYNELAFYWPEDWSDLALGLANFHEDSTIKYIWSKQKASQFMNVNFGEKVSYTLINFSERVKSLVTKNHFGLENNELRLSRVIVRQMNENHSTHHRAINFHEDIGYSSKAYQHLLSVALTTYGTPTESKSNKVINVGELLMFNAYDRRRLLGLQEKYAFIHRGPKSGPKMFLFFEFLGPNDKIGG